VTIETMLTPLFRAAFEAFKQCIPTNLNLLRGFQDFFLALSRPRQLTCTHGAGGTTATSKRERIHNDDSRATHARIRARQAVRVQRA
jgi:hypothetical protein